MMLPPLFLNKTLMIPGLETGNALELGCGSGADTIALLSKGWSVTAIDKSSEGIGFLKEKSTEFKNVDIQNTSFEQMELNEESYDLIYSRNSLSFCQKENWSSVWDRIKSSLKKGGTVSMHLFGENDGFKDSTKFGNMSLFNKNEIDEMLTDFEVLLLDESEHDAKSRMGQMKHWHIFTIVAKKI